jgi:hypothetical protein
VGGAPGAAVCGGALLLGAAVSLLAMLRLKKHIAASRQNGCAEKIKSTGPDAVHYRPECKKGWVWEEVDTIVKPKAKRQTMRVAVDFIIDLCLSLAGQRL